MRLFIAMVLGAVLLMATARAARAQVPPQFDDVWAIMNVDRGPDSMGCRGCHIGPAPALGPYWGDTEAAVLSSIEASGIVLGGRMSFFASRLERGEMPLFGQPWCSDSLDVMRAWLILYEVPTN